MVSELELKNRAKDLRNNPTPFENIIWKHLSRSQLQGYKFRRQHVIEYFIFDFFCPAKRLIVEIDGDTHDPVADAKRDRILSRKGYEVLRFTNQDVVHNLEGVLEKMLICLKERPARWQGSVPHPNPSPEGEGLL